MDDRPATIGDITAVRSDVTRDITSIREGVSSEAKELRTEIKELAKEVRLMSELIHQGQLAQANMRADLLSTIGSKSERSAVAEKELEGETKVLRVRTMVVWGIGAFVGATLLGAVIQGLLARLPK